MIPGSRRSSISAELVQSSIPVSSTGTPPTFPSDTVSGKRPNILSYLSTMKVELMMPAGPIPILPHGARPLPMIMLHVANCGRNCGIRKGRPLPVALPRIEEDYAGEWREEKPRTVKFTETVRYPPLLRSEVSSQTDACLSCPLATGLARRSGWRSRCLSYFIPRQRSSSN